MRHATRNTTRNTLHPHARCSLARYAGCACAPLPRAKSKTSDCSGLNHHQKSENGRRSIFFFHERLVSFARFDFYFSVHSACPKLSLAARLTPPCSCEGQTMTVQLTGVTWNGDSFTGSASIEGYNVSVRRLRPNSLNTRDARFQPCWG